MAILKTFKLTTFFFVLIIILVPTFTCQNSINKKNLSFISVNIIDNSNIIFSDEEQFKIRVTFKNNGSETINETWILGIFIDEDLIHEKEFDEDILPNITYEYNYSFKHKPEFDLKVRLDENNNVDEYIENDNELIRPISGKCPESSINIIAIIIALLIISIIILIMIIFLKNKMGKK